MFTLEMNRYFKHLKILNWNIQFHVIIIFQKRTIYLKQIPLIIKKCELKNTLTLKKQKNRKL